MMEANPLFAELQELTQEKSCDRCEYCKKVFSYTYPLCDSTIGVVP